MRWPRCCAGGWGPTPADAFAADCRRVTGGNPLLLDELARALQADGVRPDIASVEMIATLGPRAVSRTVLARLAHAGPDAIAVAQALAVIGDWEGVAMVEAVTGLDRRSRSSGDPDPAAAPRSCSPGRRCVSSTPACGTSSTGS